MISLAVSHVVYFLVQVAGWLIVLSLFFPKIIPFVGKTFSKLFKVFGDVINLLAKIVGEIIQLFLYTIKQVLLLIRSLFKR